MCGRYALFNLSDLYERFGVNNRVDWPGGQANVTPGRVMPVIVRQSPPRIRLMRWGLVPEWVKDQKPFRGLINARAETLESKPSFRKPLRQQRCIVPANGFYEWDRQSSQKQAYFFELQDKTIMAMAGLYEGETYTIITTAANGTVGRIHDRMPVLLSKMQEKTWIDPNIHDMVELKRCLSLTANDKLISQKASL